MKPRTEAWYLFLLLGWLYIIIHVYLGTINFIIDAVNIIEFRINMWRTKKMNTEKQIPPSPDVTEVD